MADPYLGEIRMFAGNFAINGWQMCNGQTLSISSYNALFAIIGTFYGGNGTTTFQLPNFQGRVPIHQGTGIGLPTYTVGEASGTTSVNLLTTNLPQHTHASFGPGATPTVTINASNGSGNANTPAGNYIAGKTPGTSGLNGGDLYTTTAGVLGVLNSATATIAAGSAQTGPTGGNIPVSIMQPYLTVTFLIAMVGIFPSRN